MTASHLKFLMILAFPVLVVGLILGVYATSQSLRLHLPTSSLALALAVILPIFTFLALFLPDEAGNSFGSLSNRITLPGSRPTSSNGRNFSWLRRIAPSQFRVHHAIALLTVVLLSQSASDLAREGIATCLLGERWRRLFAERDATAIRTIQDALSCCGFRNKRDRAWPFPIGSGTVDDCYDRYGSEPGRDQGCAAALESRLRTVDGALTGSAVAVFVVQLLVFYFTRMQQMHARRRNFAHQSDDNRIIDEEEDGTLPQHRRYLDETPDDHVGSNGNVDSQSRDQTQRGQGETTS